MTLRPSSWLSFVELPRQNLPLGLGVAVGLVGVMLLLRWFGTRLQANDPNCTGWSGVIGRVFAKTSILFMIAAALDVVATYADAPPRIGRLCDVLFTIAAALQAAVWARELILGVIAQRVGDDRETTIGNATAIIRVLVSVALFALALIVILDNLGVNVTALIAGLGIGGIAIGLAAQGIFSDLFAALSILFDRPFRRGDLIRYDGTTGTVERIGLKTTRLRSLSGEQVIMANTKLLEREIHNLAEANVRRVTLPFGFAATTPHTDLSSIPGLAEDTVKEQAACRFVRCVLVSVGSAGLNFELVYEDEAIDNERAALNRSAILLRLLQKLGECGIDLSPPPAAPAPAPTAVPAT